MGDVCRTLPVGVGVNDTGDFCGTGIISPWLILGLGFLAGCGFALNDPAWHASIGDILHKRDIPAAVAG